MKSLRHYEHTHLTAHEQPTPWAFRVNLIAQ
jgi:hypothetical protein